MPRIYLDSYQIRALGTRPRSLQARVAELIQALQYRLLYITEFRPFLGAYAMELEILIRSLREQEMLLVDFERRVFGWAAQVEALSLTPSYPVWLSPGFFLAAPVVTGAVFITNLYRQPPVLLSIGRLVYRGYDPVNLLASQGTYVNVAEPEVDLDVLAAERLLAQSPDGFEGPVL